MLGDDPPYLSVGTEVSAKYKGAFCEAKIRKVVRSVKCRVTYKQGLGTATVTDDQIKGTLRVGALVEARHAEKKDFVEANITKIQDCSQYTVVFDDGDITTLRRTALCLKSGRHFAESETLDQLPLTHPEHFGNPVIGGRRGRRSRQIQDDSSDDDDDGARGSNDSGSGSGGKEGPEREPEIGRVVCVELGDKKKKDNWFPGLVVAPTAQDTVRIRVRDDYLVRSFKDARYYTVPKKEATEFTKDLVNKVENSALKVAVEKALLFLEKNELPPHWDRDSLFGNSVSSGNSDSDGELDSDSSDDEPREEKDHFVAQLYKFMDDRGTPINNCPMIGNEDIDLYRLFRAVYKLGGYNRVSNQNQWKSIARRLNFSMQNSPSTHNLVKQSYKKFLHSFEDFYRKLGCTMVNHPRGNMRKQRAGRSLIRDKDRNTPIPTTQDKTPAIKTEKEDEDKDKDKKNNTLVDEEIKKEKREIKKEPVVKEEDTQIKVKRKEEPAEESASGQESDINIEAEEESSSSEKSQKSSVRLTPSSIVGKAKLTPTTAAKKEEPAKKKPAQEKKKPEPKKIEKKDDKPKEEDKDSTKTRSRSKDDVSVKGASKPNQSSSDSRESRTPSRESDKKVFTNKQRKMTDEELKKRGRKKKEVEVGEKGRGSDEKSVDHEPTYKGPVEIGDRLKVYYGPTHESKVTYEAKVIDMEKDGTEPVYLVHYTGWNTRYDEWIKTVRIAQNFDQSQGRVKRTKATPRPQTPSTNNSNILAKTTKSLTAPNAGTGAASTASTNVQNRRRAQGGGDTPTSSISSSLTNKDSSLRKDTREGTPAGRSMTPSPLTSSILRTKSPATTVNNRTTRVTRNADSVSSANESNRRTRKTSGQAIEDTDSDESDSLSSDISAGPETTTTRIPSRTRVKGTVYQERNRREARKRAESRMKIEETSDGDGEKDIEEPRRGRRVRKTIGKIQDVKSEPESDEDQQPKGRDFDLNQIRSELKGFDKAVKVEMTSVEPKREEDEDDKKNVAVKQEKVDPDSYTDNKKLIQDAIDPKKQQRETPKVEGQNLLPINKRDPVKLECTTIASSTTQSTSDNTEDIYEFKEPEPFEFEVRNKRDSGGSDNTKDKDKDNLKDSNKPTSTTTTTTTTATTATTAATKKRGFDEDLKSPKKRQKTFNTTGSTGNVTPVKAETKTENIADNTTTTSATSSAITGVTATTATEAKKKARKIFKKNETEVTEEIDNTENDDASTSANKTEVINRYYPSNYTGGGVMAFNRKGPITTRPATSETTVNTEDSTEQQYESPKKRQTITKTFGPASKPNNEIKTQQQESSSNSGVSNQESSSSTSTTTATTTTSTTATEVRRKLVRKPPTEEPEDKELAKYFPNYTAKTLPARKQQPQQQSSSTIDISETEDNATLKKVTDEESSSSATTAAASRNVRKRQKTYGSASSSTANVSEGVEAKRKPQQQSVTSTTTTTTTATTTAAIRRLGVAASTSNKKDKSEDSDDSYETVEPSTSSSQQQQSSIPLPTSTKYLSHYSGPRAKAAAAAAAAAASSNSNLIDTESLQDRLAAVAANIAKSDIINSSSSSQISETTRVFGSTAAMSSSSSSSSSHHHDKDKNNESLLSMPSTSTGSTPSQSNVDKKRTIDTSLPGKSTDTAKQELKSLDFTPMIPHTVPTPVPISARLPATASIEEKLSAAAVLRSKLKETKKDEEMDTPLPPRKILKEPIKKTEIMAAKKIKEESKIKVEPEKKKSLLSEQQQSKKDPLQEMEIRRDPLLDVIKKKDDDIPLLKSKKDSEQHKPILSTTNQIVTKTYGGQKKDVQATAKLEEAWKKAVAASSAASSSNKDDLTSEITKDYNMLRKETIVSKIKSSLERDSVDSTDSSDSERRLTIIDSEDFQDDSNKPSSNLDIKSKTVTVVQSSSSAVTSSQFNCAATIQQQERTTTIVATGQSTGLAQQINVVGLVNAMIQSKNAKMEEDGENLNSLLCEEEIPGSPTPGLDNLDHEHRATSSHNFVKEIMGNKVAVAFVAAQMPLSTVGSPASSTHLTNCTLAGGSTATISSTSGGVTIPQKATTGNLVAIPMNVSHSNIQPIRQQQQQQQHQAASHIQKQQIIIQPQQLPSSAGQIQQLRGSAIPIAVATLQQQHHHHHHHHHQRRESNEGTGSIPGIDNTPPTTPDSLMSGLSSSSPRGGDERTCGTTTPQSSSDNDNNNPHSNKAHTNNHHHHHHNRGNSSENDGKGGNNSGGPGFSEDDINSEHGGNNTGTTNTNVSSSSSEHHRIVKPPMKRLSNNSNQIIEPIAGPSGINANSSGNNNNNNSANSNNNNENVSPRKRKKRKDHQDHVTSQAMISSNTGTMKKTITPRQAAAAAAAASRVLRHSTCSDSDDTIENLSPRINNPSGLHASSNLAMNTAQTNVSLSRGISNSGGTGVITTTTTTTASSSSNIGNIQSNSSRTRFNFILDLDPNMDSNQKLSIYYSQLNKLRQTYADCKAELVIIEKRRKKIQRRKREAQKAAKAEMQHACS